VAVQGGYELVPEMCEIEKKESGEGDKTSDDGKGVNRGGAYNDKKTMVKFDMQQNRPRDS
jgi:hypothetical protein